MTKTLEDFTPEEIAQAKKELVEILSKFVDKESIRLHPTQILNYLNRKENG